MFYLQYMLSELRRRKGRTLLTALGLGVGVGLVVTVSALSTGMDRAQEEVLEPLTGVGTDVSVTRPIEIGSDGFQGLSESEREALREENGRTRFGLRDRGDPGEKFTTTNFVTGTQLSFPSSQVDKTRSLAGVADAAGGLTVTALTISGTVPEQAPDEQGGGGFGGGPPDGAQGGPDSIRADQVSVTGVDPARPSLGPVAPSHVTAGRALGDDAKREAVLNVSYAQRKGLAVGESVKLGERKYEIVGLVKTPLGGQASDAYLKLDQLQREADRKGRINVMYVRATGADAVAGVQRGIESTLAGASVTTSKDLADRIGGSLTDARDLTSKLGTALTIVGLLAAFLIAMLLTLSSVTKRIRELGTLKALGWRQRLVVRQVTGEAVLQGALGGIVGALVGIGGAALITAIGPTLEASVAAASTPAATGPGGGPGGALLAFGAGQISSGTTDVTLEAPVDAGLIALAIGLALLGGLLAGAVGGLRAARLRPADALRHID